RAEHCTQVEDRGIPAHLFRSRHRHQQGHHRTAQPKQRCRAINDQVVQKDDLHWRLDILKMLFPRRRTMRAMLWMGSVVVALAVVIGAGRLWAENKEQKPAKAAKTEMPRTRIAIVNLTFVIKNYDKYKTFQEDLKKAVEPFQERERKLRAKADKLKQRKQSSTILPANAEDIDGAL